MKKLWKNNKMRNADFNSGWEGARTWYRTQIDIIVKEKDKEIEKKDRIIKAYEEAINILSKKHYEKNKIK